MKILHALSLAALTSTLTFTPVFRADAVDINPYIKQSLSPLALNNILNSERVFCYTVDKPKEGYAGYTIDQMALTGFCGVLERKDAGLFINEFFIDTQKISKTVANCTIAPKIMLRFIRGVDATDVLFSNPCPSMTVFYGGTLKSFNAEPAKKTIEAFVDLFYKNSIDFVSPALLNQTLPIGIAQTAEQKALVAKQKEVQPIRKWSQPAQATPSTSGAQKPAAPQGWNKLKN